MAVLESLAAGRPCVTTDVGCCRTLLEGGEDDDFGPAGMVVPPMHSPALANAMEVLATRPDLREEMAEAGVQRVKAHYVHQDMVDHYNQNYEEVAAAWRALDLN